MRSTLARGVPPVHPPLPPSTYGDPFLILVKGKAPLIGKWGSKGGTGGTGTPAKGRRRRPGPEYRVHTFREMRFMAPPKALGGRRPLWGVPNYMKWRRATGRGRILIVREICRSLDVPYAVKLGEK